MLENPNGKVAPLLKDGAKQKSGIFHSLLLFLPTKLPTRFKLQVLLYSGASGVDLYKMFLRPFIFFCVAFSIFS